MVDVHIIYEHKARELENSCLLKAELEHRGYSVKISNMYSPLRYFVKSKLLIVPHLYDDKQVSELCKNFWLSNTKVLDMQYEQILNKEEINKTDIIHNPQGQAKNAFHLAWGNSQAIRYRMYGIKPNRICIGGSISIDLLNPLFDPCFLDRNSISKEFGLDATKKWNMFISSFSYNEKSIDKLELLSQKIPSTLKFAECSRKSYSIIVEWFKEACLNNPNQIFIYRKHPAEEKTNKLLELERQFDNFYYISKYSIRQWVRVADVFYNWYSTSYVDLYYSHKKMYLLRPVVIPDKIDIDIFDDIEKIQTKKMFLKSLESSVDVDKQNNIKLENYFDVTDKYAFEKISDICERLIKSDEHVNYKYKSSRFDMTDTGSFLKIVCSYINVILYLSCIVFKIKKLGPFKKAQLFNYKNEIYGASNDGKKYLENFKKILFSYHCHKQSKIE